MRQHLTNLLYEEYKQQQLTNYLEPLIQDLVHFNTRIYSTVIDIIGFPEEDLSSPPRRGNMFTREWLYDEYHELLSSLTSKYSLFTGKGLELNKKFDEKLVKAALAGHIDWLYEEFKSFQEKKN